MRLLVLSVALAPYLGFIAIDAWMHEKARRVPTVEQWLHGGIALAIGSFFLMAFLGADTIAGILLVVTRAKGLRDHFAYGPPLTVGAYAAIVWGDRLVDWYLG